MVATDKENFVKNLSKPKVILGNGFDLHCGLYTRYSDYFCKNWKNYIHLQKLAKEFINSEEEFCIPNDTLEKINIWDIFFSVNSSDNPKRCSNRWCDIESLMLDSLMGSEHRPSIIESIVKWPNVKRIVEGRDELEHTSQGFVALFAKNKMNHEKWGIGQLYPFLLDQLKEFEKEFGDFIYWQLHFGRFEESHFGVKRLNEVYIEKAKYVLNCLCDIKNASIDTFNYSFIEDEEIASKTSHINGSHKEPIFGIDSRFEPTDKRYIFTKTCRRIESEMNNYIHSINEKFDNIIVFGHSLDETDYSYFFPIFDQIELLDLTAKGIAVFAYCIWDKNKRDIIEITLREDVSKMIYEYALEKKVSNPNRILDSLSIQKKIVFYEIPEFPTRLRFAKTDLDIEWANYHKEIEFYEDSQTESHE